MGIRNRVEASGATIVVIGSSTPEQAKDFAEQFKFEGELYVDTTLETYKAFQLDRGFFRTLGLSSISRGFTAMKSGSHQGLSAGDLWQQGGVFIMGPGKQILYQHRDEFAGDHADLEAVVRECQTQGETGTPLN